jgi:1-acyl-sn-glycerol-3-phosphate acyltransferase
MRFHPLAMTATLDFPLEDFANRAARNIPHESLGEMDVAEPVSTEPLSIAQQSVAILRTQMSVQGQFPDPFPGQGPILLVSNHRSFMDPLVLMAAAQRSIRFACHPYMQQVPGLRQMIHQLGCLPLDSQQTGQRNFLRRAEEALQRQQPVGIFPEGGTAMVAPPPLYRVGPFNRGFAHLALRAKVTDLNVLPVALLALQEQRLPSLPLSLFSHFSPSEPLFRGDGWHPILLYRKVVVLVGQPWVVTEQQQQAYRENGARSVLRDLTGYCQTQVQQLLQQGYWGGL